MTLSLISVGLAVVPAVAAWGAAAFAHEAAFALASHKVVCTASWGL